MFPIIMYLKSNQSLRQDGRSGRQDSAPQNKQFFMGILRLVPLKNFKAK